jgi:hypothetical protein
VRTGGLEEISFIASKKRERRETKKEKKEDAKRTSQSPTITNNNPMIPTWTHVQTLQIVSAVESLSSSLNNLVHESTPVECWAAEMIMMARERRRERVTRVELKRELWR